MSDPTRGACLCGTVSFEIDPPFHWLAHCHCSMCRKHHGTLFGTGLGVERAKLRWLSGRKAIVHYRSTDSFERAFCGRCGSKVPGDSHLPDVVVVPAGTLEGDFGLRPRAHIFVGSKSPLVTINDQLTQFQAYPPGVDLPVVERAAVRARPGTVAGSCLCGDVGFEVSGEINRLVHCHCSLCRRSRGTAFASALLTAPERFQLDSRPGPRSQLSAAPAAHLPDGLLRALRKPGAVAGSGFRGRNAARRRYRHAARPRAGGAHLCRVEGACGRRSRIRHRSSMRCRRRIASASSSCNVARRGDGAASPASSNSSPKRFGSGVGVEDEGGALLRDHDGRRVGVARRDARHDRRVDHAQACDAAHAQPIVDDGERVDAHAARADGVEDRRAEIAGRAPQLGVASAARARAAIPRGANRASAFAAMMRRVKLQARRPRRAGLPRSRGSSA